jgi:hypothetical protein
MRDHLRSARLGITVVVLGALLNVIGLTRLSPQIDGAYFNRAVAAAPDDAVIAGSVSGTSWLVAGTGLMLVGGLSLAASSRRG